MPCHAPAKVALLNPQAKRDVSRFRALVLIGVAAAFCAAVNPLMTKPSVASKLVEINHPDACPPQWLPVLLASSSSHIDSPAPRFDEEDLALANQQRFSWDALNVTNATICGGDKCYFQGEREGEGWLVGWRLWNDLKLLGKAWAFAEELRAEFGVDHLLRGPPFLATLAHQQAKHLNAKINISLSRRKHPPLVLHPPYKIHTKDGVKQIYAAGPHPVQAVRSCSWPECMVLKCTHLIGRHGPDELGRLGPADLSDPARMDNTAQAIEGFVASASNKSKLSLGLQQNFALVTAMLKAHPCLKHDFQVYLRNDGAVLNIDLDRCKRSKSGSVSLSKKDKRTLGSKTMTLTTEPLRLTCRDLRFR